MSSYFSPYLFLSFLFIIIINFFVNLPISFCADDPNFLACSQAFDCGNIRKISYPFWKSGRVEYCGHPDFELKCQDDDSAEIQFESVTYRVLRIDKSNRKLQLATTVSWNDNCPSTFDNISFPSNDWSYLDR
ncbi:LEAF RUST 10 DISEASE-RESISTANCE LOCUS RECEPTOR-LIKE PROTEIN KINASE-like 2.1, partial [Thalictrum thalictroides]